VKGAHQNHQEQSDWFDFGWELHSDQSHQKLKPTFVGFNFCLDIFDFVYILKISENGE